MSKGKNLFEVAFRMTNYGLESHVTRTCWLKHPGTFMRITSVEPNPRDGMRGTIEGSLRFKGMRAAEEEPKRVRASLKKGWMLLWDSSRNEVVVPQAIRALPEEQQQQWEEAYFGPARAAAASGSPTVALVSGANTRVGSSAAFDAAMAGGAGGPAEARA